MLRTLQFSFLRHVHTVIARIWSIFNVITQDLEMRRAQKIAV